MDVFDQLLAAMDTAFNHISERALRATAEASRLSDQLARIDAARAALKGTPRRADLVHPGLAGMKPLLPVTDGRRGKGRCSKCGAGYRSTVHQEQCKNGAFSDADIKELTEGVPSPLVLVSNS